MITRTTLAAITLACAVFAAPHAHAAPPWKPAPGPLQTRWTATVAPDAPWQIYPRPQFARDEWRSLNGLWEYAIRPRTQPGTLAFPAKADGEILVPFPVESQLSGVGKAVAPGSELVYRRTFDMPEGFNAGDARTLLHFGAVDWQARVQVNGRTIGEHQGGFDPFSFDITGALRAGRNEIIVAAWDPTDSSTQPRGKQVLKPEGIFYTAVTGIWQTVWLEQVPAVRVGALEVRATRATGDIACDITLAGSVPAGWRLAVPLAAPDGSQAAGAEAAATGERVAPTMRVAGPRAWSPADPALYDITVTLTDKAGAVRDRVRSYCAFRDIALVRPASGPPHIELNGSQTFMLGLLDQGWWPDGLYTPPSYEAMVYDLEVTRLCGFNTIRKHVKVEPAVWYAACDRMGILVWQDMPSGDRSISPTDPDIERAPASAATYERELDAMVEFLRPFPSIVLWVPFNEGWGQYDSARITEHLRTLDPTRLVTTASGWADRETGDTLDIHDYTARLAGRVPDTTSGRAWVVGECGGYGLPLPGHLWQASGWGYTNYKDCDALTVAYERLAGDLRELRAEGLCAAIYTQTTDVESEVNGLMTYDRDAIKMNSARVAAANRAVIDAVPSHRPVQVIVPTARDAQRDGKPAPEWRMTTTQPQGDWAAPLYDASAWQVCRGGFGRAGTPGTNGLIGTEWETPAIWLRRQIAFPAGEPLPTHIVVHHDEAAEVWLDGRKIAELAGYTQGYTRVPIAADIARGLTHGKHVLAVHCTQTTGGQFIDVGFCTVPSYTPTP